VGSEGTFLADGMSLLVGVLSEPYLATEVSAAEPVLCDEEACKDGLVVEYG